MAHHVEPMDIDSEFDNKENSLHHNNVLPFTEKGYEELDVSELNMKLRYSITPASSPMSKSYTANCVDNRITESGDDTLNVTTNENSNLTRSLNSNVTRNDSVVKSLKTLPLQAISTEQFVDNNRSTSVLRPLDTTITQDNVNVTVTVSQPGDIDDNLSSSSSAVQTPEATTPTTDTLKNDGGGSPIMRGIKSVLNMFRSSQSPIPPAENENIVKPDILSPVDTYVTAQEVHQQALLASTPISAHRKKETSPTKRNSPNKDTIVFNEDLEKELQWKDETTIIFSQERIPIHKLFFQPTPNGNKDINQDVEKPTQEIQDDMNSTVEYMDISYNDSLRDRTMTDMQFNGNKTDCTTTGESDGEFVDCETTITKNDSLLDDGDKTPLIDRTQDLDLTKYVDDATKNTSGSRLKQIILNTTQDILDATLSITPEDLLPEASLKAQRNSGQVSQYENTEANVISDVTLENDDVLNDTTILEESLTVQDQLPTLNQTVDVLNPAGHMHLEENPNITKAYENVIQPVLNETVDMTDLPTNIEIKEATDITKTVENISSENQQILENLVSTPASETIVQNDNITNNQLTNNNDNNLIQDITHDIELNKTVHNRDHNTSMFEKVSSPETLKEAINKSLPNIDSEIISSPMKEASMTELAAEVPLPDEDDLEKELDIISDASAQPNSLPLDLVDDIKVQQDIPEILNVPAEDVKEKVPHDEKNIVLCLPVHTPNIDVVDNIQNTTVLLDSEALNPVPKVIDAKIELLLPEEPQISIDVLPEPALSTNIDFAKTENLPEQPHDVGIMNQSETATECVNATATFNTAENVRPSQEILPMDINESVIVLKPLPDIINQTNITPNVGNLESATNIPDQVILEQTPIYPKNLENVSNEVTNLEMVPGTIHNSVPELLSDANFPNMTEPASEFANVITEEFPNISDREEINMIPHPNDTETTASETKLATEVQLTSADVIPTESDMLAQEKAPHIVDDAKVNEGVDKKTEDDEIVISENNSPFVSVIAENILDENPEENIDVQNIDDHLPRADEVARPDSPPIVSKGYNFNFDEIDDPFATKTKIRVSPSLDTPIKAVEPVETIKSAERPMPKKEIMNRRKSQPERKKPLTPKRKLNSTFAGADSGKTAETSVKIFDVGDINPKSPPNVALDPSKVTIEEDKLIEEAKMVHEMTLNMTKKIEQDIKPEDKGDQCVIMSSSEVIDIDESKESKVTSSSEHSAYFSAGTSSSESIPSKNVFNIPEIDDKNFNPFATKSKMRQSPPPGPEMENPFASRSKITNSPDSSLIHSQDEIVKPQDISTTVLPDDKMETELMEKDASGNLSSTTNSSKATDERNGTIKEVNTEDEDTIEGPFLEPEDLNNEDKMSDIDGENIDMMQFNDLPTQGNDDNLDNGELFIDAEAFEFLLNQNKCNTVVDSGKESLFLKFDPLFAKRMSSITSDNLVASLNKFQRQSTPTKVAMKEPEKEVKSPIAGPSNLNKTQDMDISHNLSEELNDDLNITVSKPMMVVPPAVNPVTPRNKSLTPNRSNRRSITFTSPAMAVIDRLLSLSGNSSLIYDTATTQTTREQNEADLALTQLRELLAEKEVHVYSLRSESIELKDRLTSLESHLKSLEEESQDRLQKINDLNDRLAEKTKINKSMAAVVEEYERTIASLISETAQDKKRHAEERIKLINERDEQTAHLASMEVSFSDLHSKYEKSKQVIQSCKANEETYKKSIKEFEENFNKMQTNYELLKQHATSKLNHANQELEKINRSHEADVLKLNAMIKRKELHITSLEESLAQKTKANEELTAICDELINKVG